MSSKNRSNRRSVVDTKVKYSYPNVKPKNINQSIILSSIEKKPVTLIAGSAGTGKAQPLYSKIKVPNGWKTFADIKIGDLVATPKGNYVPVLNIYPQGIKPIYRITLNDDRYVDCSEDHLWSWIYDNGKPKINSLKEILEKYSTSTRKNRFFLPLTNNIEEAQKEFNIPPYLLGALIGDGCFRSNRPTFCTADLELVEKIQSLLIPGYSINKIPSSEYDYSIKENEHTTLSNYYTIKLQELGLWNKLSYEKEIPESYLYGSIDQRIELLQGLLDTDGTVDHRTGSVEFYSTSKILAEQVQYLIWSLGGSTKITTKETTYTYKDEKKEGRLCYRLTITRFPNKQKLLYLSRKKKLVTIGQYDNIRKIGIKNIEFIDNLECKCIYIDDPDHLYITDNFIVTHNTFLSVVKAIDMLEAGKVHKLIISRPAVTTEQVGFLPGTLEEKMDPLMGPIFDSIIDYRSPRYLESMLNIEFSLEIASFAYLRGRTFNNCFILVDEAQNCTIEQTRMMLTRLGEGSTMVITGDPSQSDLKDKSKQDGLSWAISRLKECPIVNTITMIDSDIVRSIALQQLMPYLQESDSETS